MAHDDVECKETTGRIRSVVARCLTWAEKHPRTGWYIAVLATLNFFLNLVDAINLFGH